MKVHVRSGLDNLKLAHDALNGRRIGLLTHPCGFDSTFTSTIDILHANYRLTALFACEHGIRGSVVAGAHIDQETDAATGLPVFSLYGDTKMPTPEMLSEIDVFVVDLQDVGARFYTYIYSLAFAMIACARAGKPIVVLDRINPIGGRTVQGTLLDERFHSFVGEYAVPTRYGLTIGEFARFVKDHLKLDVDLTVVPLTGWEARHAVGGHRRGVGAAVAQHSHAAHRACLHWNLHLRGHEPVGGTGHDDAVLRGRCAVHRRGAAYRAHAGAEPAGRRLHARVFHAHHLQVEWRGLSGRAAVPCLRRSRRVCRRTLFIGSHP